MKKLLLFISVFVVFVSTACGITSNLQFEVIEGSGNIVTEVRNVSGFEQVEVCCGMELYLVQGDRETLEIKADDNFMDEIITSVVGNRLEIKYQQTNNVSYRPSNPVQLYLTMEDVRGVALSGGGYLEFDRVNSESFDLSLSGGSDAWIGELTTGNIDLSVSGGGKLNAGSIAGDQVVMRFSGGSAAQLETLTAASVDVGNSGGGTFAADACEVDQLDLDFSGSSDAEILALKAETLRLNVSGGGIIEISGEVAEQDVSLAGGSRYQAADLKSERTTFSASGGDDSSVWVMDTLSVGLSGGSSLGYYGNPQIVDQNISGGGDLDSLGERE